MNQYSVHLESKIYSLEARLKELKGFAQAEGMKFVPAPGGFFYLPRPVLSVGIIADAAKAVSHLLGFLFESDNVLYCDRLRADLIAKAYVSLWLSGEFVHFVDIDGFEIGKELSASYHWLISDLYIEALDEMPHVIQHLLDEAERKWVVSEGVRPIFQVGEMLEDGVITSIDRERGYYTVNYRGGPSSYSVAFENAVRGLSGASLEPGAISGVPDGPSLAAKRFVPPMPLASETRTHLTTREAAHHLNRKMQTLHIWASKENGPIRPERISGRLAWRVSDILQLLNRKEGHDHD